MRVTMSIFCGLVLILACNPKNESAIKEANEMRVISNLQVRESLNFSEIGNQLNIIKLDNEIILGKIDRIVFAFDHFYILDKDFASGIFKYNKKGELKSKILFDFDQKFDFNSITDFFYDENLIVHDGNKGINFILDEDLTILKQQKLNFKANSFYSFENKWVIFNNYLQRDWGNDLLVIDKDDFSVSSAYIPVNSDDYGFHYDARYALNVDNSGNQLYFSKAFNDTIYTLNKDFLLDKKFLIDFKDKRVSKNYLQSGINAMDLLSDMRNGNFYFIKGEMHFTSDNKLLIKILKEGKYENLLIDDIENSGEVFPVFVDDFQSNQSFYDVLYSDKEQLIFGESSEHLYQSQNLDPSFKEKYTIKSEDNFILFVLDK